MKEVMAIIRPNKYFATKRALIKEGFNAMSTREALGRGKRKAVFRTELQEEETVGIEFIAKRLLDIVVRDEDVPKVMRILLEENSTGHPGDGKIFILPVRYAMRVRTGQEGDDILV